MRHTLVGRRTFIARLAGSSVALGLGAVVVGAPLLTRDDSLEKRAKPGPRDQRAKAPG